MPYKYILTSNDNFSIPFSQYELEHCKYAKNIFTDIYDNWVESHDRLNVPIMNQHELGALRLFLQTRVHYNVSPEIRKQGPVITTCPVYIPNEIIPWSHNLIYWPAIITTNIITKWDSYNTGLPEEYHSFMKNTLHRVRRSTDEPEAVTVERWIQFALFLGCDDLSYILQAQFAWCIAEALECYPKQSPTQYIFDANHFKHILENTDIYLDPEYIYLYYYIEVFANMRLNYPELAKHIVLKFLQHQSAPMPHEDWSKIEWESFHNSLDNMYRTVYYHEGE